MADPAARLAGDAAGAEQGLRLGAALWWYWHVRGDYAECRALLAPCSMPPAPAPGVGRGRATALAVAARGLGDYATARARSETGLALLRELDDAPWVAQALLDVGCAAMSQGTDRARAREAFAEAQARGRALGEDWITAWALTFQGLLALAGGDLPAAGAAFEESLAIRRTLEDTFGIAWSRYGLASVARLRESQPAPGPSTRRPGHVPRPGERPTLASILDGLGEVAIALAYFGVPAPASPRAWPSTGRWAAPGGSGSPSPASRPSPAPSGGPSGPSAWPARRPPSTRPAGAPSS